VKSDVYSFAVTLWEIWSRCSCLPYVSLTNEDVYQRILSQKNENKNNLVLNLTVPPDCPKEIYDLLCECWHIDGTKRPNIADITLYFKRHVDASRLNHIS
jgi:discoidin domain receptor family protein 2